MVSAICYDKWRGQEYVLYVDKCYFVLVLLSACAESLDVSGGWLQDETMVQIQIHPTKHQPITMQHQGPIKLCFQQQRRDDSGGLLAVQPMHVKVGGGCCKS